MNNGVSIELESKQDERGRWESTCPFCDWKATGFLNGFCKTQMVRHMNEKHRDGRIGNA